MMYIIQKLLPKFIRRFIKQNNSSCICMKVKITHKAHKNNSLLKLMNLEIML